MRKQHYDLHCLKFQYYYVYLLLMFLKNQINIFIQAEKNRRGFSLRFFI